jgi:uncharacterized protein (TIGR02217 family)
VTTPPSFPSLSGLGWSVHKKPVFSTIVASHVSGREVRDALYQNPIWQFELTIDGMDSTSSAYAGLGANSLQSLMGFFLLCQGQYSTFLYTDLTDNTINKTTGGYLLNPNSTTNPTQGDGSTTTFTFARYMGVFFEPVGWVTSTNSTTSVWVGGSPVAQSGGWSISTPNSLVFNSPPANGATIAANFTYAFQCRFDDDDMDFDQFMSNLWKVESVKFKSVRTS